MLKMVIYSNSFIFHYAINTYILVVIGTQTSQNVKFKYVGLIKINLPKKKKK